MVGRRWRREGSGRLKHLKTQRGLALPFGSSCDDDDYWNDDADEEDKDVFFGFSEKFRNRRVE